MTDPISARLREDVFYGEERMIKFGKHNPLHMEAADHIDAQAATIKALVEALERIASRHVTEGPLWWQVEARAALAAARVPK